MSECSFQTLETLAVSFQHAAEKEASGGNLPDKIVAFIFVWIQEAVVKGCLMEGFLSAAWGRRGSAQRGETAPGRRHGGQSWHRQAALASCPGGHNISRIVTIACDGVAPTASVCVPRASRAAATRAGHWTRPTSALLWPVAWHHARPTRNSPKSAALLFKASGQCCYLATLAGRLASWLACVLASWEQATVAKHPAYLNLSVWRLSHFCHWRRIGKSL